MPGQARNFQRALMRLNQPRLNAAHFLLASILGVQPTISRPSSSFKAPAAFSRLILTTNFDPFLQIALQAVNHLYFMSDSPEVGVSDEILDDQIDAIHLVYLHGSVHRRSQLASDEDIQRLKRKNAQILAPVLKRHGIIVLGYSGWDDVIVEALAECETFDYGLFWCGLEADPLTNKAAFGDRVADILRKPATFYVQTAGAGPFMAQLCNQLVEGLPRLISNPIAQITELLDAIDLKELDRSKPKETQTSKVLQFPEDTCPNEAFLKAKASTIQCLKDAEKLFLARVKVQPLVDSAALANSLANYAESVKLCSTALDLPNLDLAPKLELRRVRAFAHYSLGQLDAAMADVTWIIQQEDAPADEIASSLILRGILWAQTAKKADTEKAIADLTRAIELKGTPIHERAWALSLRGAVWSDIGQTDKAIADYTRLIDLKDAPAEPVARALLNRAITWSQKGDTDKELADYSRLIDLKDAPNGDAATAFTNRGWVRYQQGQNDVFLSDTQAAINKDTNNGSAAFNLGLALLACNRDAEARVAYRQAAERFPQGIDHGGMASLAEAQKTWLSPERTRPILDLLQSLAKPAPPSPPTARTSSSSGASRGNASQERNVFYHMTSGQSHPEIFFQKYKELPTFISNTPVKTRPHEGARPLCSHRSAQPPADAPSPVQNTLNLDQDPKVEE
jgi:tetratricopeptide (TPR) repeat protein